MTEQLERFITLLKGIFELDKSDLDFGIYRIMNIRKKEIEKFLEEGLPARVKDALAPFAANTADIEKRIAEIETQCDNVGIEVAQSKMAKEYKQLKASLAKGIDLSGLEADVYSQLYSFFNRYYEEGDFISKRRYKEGVYAIPYEGEEVKLYWANQDQYYIKTSENFKDYTFVADGYNIHFRLVDATTEQNNNKESKDNKRVFMLYTEDPEHPELKTFEFDEAKKELIIRFVFDIPEDKKAKYEELNDKAITTWLIGNCQELVPVLLTNISSDPKKKQNLLQKHLRSYVAKNTFDYFIHKDLKKFLSRELDFFIKNEVMHLDDVDTTDEKRVDTWLAKVRAIKRVGKVIIDFLASIEDFQKKLWLKKKFVVQCDYCITLDRVPEKFYKEIAQNINQWQEWEKLGFFRLAHDASQPDELVVKFDEPGINDYLVFLSSGRIEEIKGSNENSDLPTYLFDVSDFFTQFKYLLVDTKFFNQNFKEQLLACIEDFDEQCNGLLLNGDNFHALEFLNEKYRQQISCIYIDPPYNAKSSEILYKNTFKHSSWLSFLEGRIDASKSLLSENAVHICAIDEIEQVRLGMLLKQIFPLKDETCVSVQHNPTGQQGDGFSYTHDFAYFTFSNKGKSLGLEDRDGILRESEPDIRPLRNVSSGKNHFRESAANCFYPIIIKDGKIIKIGEVSPKDYHPGSINVPMEDGSIAIYPIDPSGQESKWVFAQDTVSSILSELTAEFDKKKNTWDIIRRKSKFRYKSLWAEKRYSANSYGSVILNNILPQTDFLYPKSLYTVRDSIDIGLGNINSGIVLDYFAGSATTGHAILNLNREDNGNRKYILVEMGEYFNTVTKPRIEKVIYSSDWKDGRPQAVTPEPKKKNSAKTLGLDLGKDSLGFALVEDGELTDSGTVKMANPYNGISHCFKYMRLESYEDALSNVTLPDEANVNRLTSLFGEEYLIKYMLDLDTAGSVLNLAAFNDPFDYKLKVTEKNETKEVNADLMETFNYLIGLTVDKMYARKIFSATPDPAGEYDGAVKLTGNDNGEYIFRQIEGTLPSGERALIIWRNITDNLLESNAALDAYFQRYRINPADREFDVIFVNGDNNIANLKNTEETWKVRMIEPEFKTRMFEEE